MQKLLLIAPAIALATLVTACDPQASASDVDAPAETSPALPPTTLEPEPIAPAVQGSAADIAVDPDPDAAPAPGEIETEQPEPGSSPE